VIIVFIMLSTRNVFPYLVVFQRLVTV